MNKFIYWLMGERAGRSLIGIWHWLWGIPVESGGKIAVEIAEESLRSMQEGVQKLTVAVSTQVAAYQSAKQKYNSKVNEKQLLENQAIAAQKNNREDAARLAMLKVIQIEQILPQLEQQVRQAEQFVNASKDKLNRERMKLEAYKTDMQNMKDMAEINAALGQIAKLNNELNIDSARSQFEQAKGAVQRRYLQEQTLVELSENPAEKAQSELDNLVIDDEVSRRLRMLSSFQ
ncbi:MAG: PspA/IM30 family protein [Actinomycetota bacterium]